MPAQQEGARRTGPFLVNPVIPPYLNSETLFQLADVLERHVLDGRFENPNAVRDRIAKLLEAAAHKEGVDYSFLDDTA